MQDAVCEAVVTMLFLDFRHVGLVWFGFASCCVGGSLECWFSRLIALLRWCVCGVCKLNACGKNNDDGMEYV